MLGNIKFIGELGKLDMLHEGILHRCIQQLLEKKTKKQTVQDMGEDFECLCKILKTVGRALDHDKARLWMDQYFDRIKTIMEHPDLPARIRFMLLDVVELRENQWNERRSHEIGPKTIQQVRAEAIREYGYVSLPNTTMTTLNMNMDPFGRPLNGAIIPPKSTMGDIFGPVSPPFMGSSSIGTGPGVVDDFTPSFLNSKPGKHFDKFLTPYGNNGGKPNDKRQVHNSPRFDRYEPPRYHREKEADNDSDEDYVSPIDHQNNRQNNRNGDKKQPPRFQNNNPNSQGRDYRGNYQSGNYQNRHHSPYMEDEVRKENRSPNDDNWRSSVDDKRQKRAIRPGIDDVHPPQNGPQNGPQERSRRDNWDHRDERNAQNERSFRDPIRKGERNFDSREDATHSPRRKGTPEGYDGGRVQKGRDWKGSPRFDDDRDNSRERPGYQNGDVADRDFRENRDFRDNREFRDNRGFRDFGPRHPPKESQPAARELPPRFQRKQQQQQSPSDLFTSEVPSPSPDEMSPVGGTFPIGNMPPGGPPQRFRHPLMAAPHPGMPGFYPPRYPPPGGPPPIRGPPPRGFPGMMPHGMPMARFPMGNPAAIDGMREQVTPGAPVIPPIHTLPKGPANKQEEISLRPGRNFPTMLRPNVPSMLPTSAQNPHLGPSHQQMIPDILGPGPGGPQPVVKPTNLTIKQVPAHDKKDKRKVPNKEEVKQSTENMLSTFLANGDVKSSINTLKNMKPPRWFMPEMISMFVISGLEKGDCERENISKLIHSMKLDGLLAADLYMDGLGMVLGKMSDLEQEIPLVKSNVAKFAAQAVGDEIISLSDLSEPLRNGAHYPFFLLCLQQLHKVKDNEWLIKAFNNSKIDLLNMLPECDRNKDRMIEILDDRSLSFMFPLLRVQSDLWKQVRTDPNPANIYKWIKDNVDANLQTEPGFIEILITNVLKYITSESTLRPGLDENNPDKAAIDKEKELLDKFKGVLQRLLLDNTKLQMIAIYSIQILGYNNNFPKGLMLRMFMNMYDMEIIDEETFLKWKEEVNDKYPGKGNVLFQVNQWLTWLEQAEEESEEEI